jgi:hypothetical protein
VRTSSRSRPCAANALGLRVTSFKLQVVTSYSYGFIGCARHSRLEKQPTDPAYVHARQLREATRGKGEWTKGICWRDLPYQTMFPSLGLAFLLLKLAQMGICRNDLPVTDETMH